MKISDTINASQYLHILINVLDRLVDFYVILYAALENNNEMKAELVDFRDSTRSYFINAGFSEQDLIELNAVDECLDIFQVNYSYCRDVYQGFRNASHEKNPVYKKLAQCIYELNSGNIVELVNNVPVIHPGTPDEQDLIKVIISNLIARHPCIHLLRIADIVNVPDLKCIIPLIDSAIKSSRNIDYIDHKKKNHDNERTIGIAIDNIIKLVDFYPERLYPGLRYIFPQFDEIQNYNSLAISFSHKTSTRDMQNALNDINFQFEKFKIYYHNQEINFIDDIRLERLKPFISKPVRDNEYIKQLNSIEGTFHALFAWERYHLDGLSKAEAINEAHLLLNESRDLTIPTEDYKRKVRERFKTIEGYIKDKASYIQSLT